ncbi:hypothetical protein [Chryseobacterium lathyri]|uniref:hypothetical protein n=1 Tax=Chryseobacterium lathyri TaxID=395933 RepID=UPI00278A7315|nr:hypothetical protein [Chryseobacterium lathyri]MDQ0065650.1 hypothetical protein [Chryseobacterium lathyri]
MKKIKHYCYAFAFITGTAVQGQIGVGTATPDPSALLDLNASNKGLLLPRVTLTSTSDITTVPNPAKGLLVYATQNFGTGITAIQKDTLYKFDGTQWKPLTTREKFISNELPKIVAVGRKTSTTDTCNGLTGGWFALNYRSNPALLTATGAFTAPQAGYYMFSVRAVQLMPAAGQDFEIGPYIKAQDLVTFAFKYRGAGLTTQKISVLGTVYLTQGQSTTGFQWFLGQNTCGTTGRIQEQEVIWEYLGNPI